MQNIFYATAMVYWKYLSFLLIGFIVACFLSNHENLYMIHYGLDLFYGINNTLTAHNQRQTHYLSSILNYLISSLSESKGSSASSLIMISMLSLFECTACCSSLSKEEITLFIIVNWISHCQFSWDNLWCLLNMA